MAHFGRVPEVFFFLQICKPLLASVKRAWGGDDGGVQALPGRLPIL